MRQKRTTNFFKTVKSKLHGANAVLWESEIFQMSYV